MPFLKLSNYNFRHLILGLTAMSIIVLTLLVAFISSYTAFNEMNQSLYQQSVHITKNMANDSVTPLLYDSSSGAQDMLNTLIDMRQITEASIIRSSHKPLLQQRDPDHQDAPYPVVSLKQPFKAIETEHAWYFSALVLSQQNSGNLTENFFEEESADTSAVALGYVNLGVSKKFIQESQFEIFLRNATISIIACLFLLFMMYQVLRSLTLPLEKISELMEQGKRGNYPDKTDIYGTREITDISDSFNEMIFAIKEREQNLKLTLDSIGDAVIVTDAEGNVVRMNPVAEKLTGWKLQQIKGQSIKTVFPIINATTRQPIKNPVEKVLETGETIYLSNHTTLIAKDKTEYQIADSAAPICNDDGTILGMVLVFNDVTEQYKLRQTAAKSERDMHAVMDNTPAVIYVKDLDGNYLYINCSFEELFDLKREDFIGKNDYDLYSNEVADNLRSNDKLVINSKKALELEETVPLNDGVHSYLSVKFPMFDNEDKVYAMCGISTDITERIKQDEQLRRSQKMDALGKLTGGVAHDYNNMLGVVMGYAEILHTELSDQPKLKKYADKIYHAGERGANLTKKLLAFSRQKKNDAETLDLNQLLISEKDMLEKVLTARIKLIFKLTENLPSIFIDSGDMEDAIVNLCINAMHAMHDGGTLTIQTHNQTLNTVEARTLHLVEGHYVKLSLTDTGCGMSHETKDKIFEPFFTTKGEHGTGLGLAQVYGFLTRSHGAIQVYSELGQGSEFNLYFPCHKATKNKNVKFKNRINNNLNGTETILVVDDEPALLDLTGEILNKHNYKTLFANNAKQALSLLGTQPVDLIVSDVIMPEMDGYQLAAAVHKKYPQIKIQLASGFSDERHMGMVDENLHAQLINKPFRGQELLQKIRALLDD